MLVVFVVGVDGFVSPPRSPPPPQVVVGVAPDGADVCLCCFPAPRAAFFVVVKYGFVLTGFWLGSIFTVTAGTDSNADDDEAADTSAVEEGDGEDPELKGTILVQYSPGGESLLRFPNVGGLSSTLLILSSTITSVVGVVGVVALLFLEEKSGTDRRGCGIDSSERLLHAPS